MQWDVGLGRAMAHTLLVSGGAALLAAVAAVVLTVGVYFVRIPFGRFIAGLICSMLLIPVYVQATAWSAGFGIQGWMRLSQVDAAKYPWWGIASVIWIHAIASVPACFLILAYGWHRARDATFEQAWIEFGPRYVATRILPIRLAPWIAGAFLWTFCMTQNDMVVTNLFQVPTLCESVYQQVQFGNLRSGPILAACVIASFLGAFSGALIQRILKRAKSGDVNTQASWDPLPIQSWPRLWLANVLVWGIFATAFVLPWLGMVIRIGIESRMVDGQAIRSWSLSAFASSLRHVMDYRAEIGWSCALAGWTTLVTMIVAVSLITCIPLRRGSAWVLGGMVFLLALPGPIVNLSIAWFLNTAMLPSLQFLGDQTLLGPILALQTRCLPVAYGILWLTQLRFVSHHESILAIDKSLPAWLRGWVWFRFAWGAMAASALACVLIALGDLASYLLVQPPGVTTVAMRMFDLLHYGIRNREASLALVLSAVAILPSWWLARRIQPPTN
jgi:iron(III) transport system permease protein